MLLSEHAHERGTADVAATDQHLTQQATASALLGERPIQLGCRQQALFDQERPERPPRKVRVIHRLLVSACVRLG
jgi:hypothetical protein